MICKKICLEMRNNNASIKYKILFDIIYIYFNIFFFSLGKENIPPITPRHSLDLSNEQILSGIGIFISYSYLIKYYSVQFQLYFDNGVR